MDYKYLLVIFKKNWPIFLFLTLVLILFSPILFSNRLFPGFDPLLVFYPYSFHYLYNNTFWISGILSGFSIWLAPASFAGNWIYYFSGIKFFDFITFYSILIFFYFILTAIFSYLVSRKIGFDEYVSVLVSSVFIWSAYNLSWMVNVVTASSLFILPALIYFILKFKEKYNWFWSILGGMFLGFGLTMGQPQFVMIAVLGIFLFSLSLIFESDLKKPKWIFLVVFLVICLIGLTLASFQLLPEYQFIKSTQRGTALNFQDSQVCAFGISDFVRYIIPNFNFGVSCESLLYVGVLPLILAIFSVIYLRKDRRILFWLLLLAFAFLFSIKYSPLARIFHQFPIWNSLRGPGRFVMFGNFALAVLSGYGFNWILESKENFKELKIFLWIKRIFLGFLFLIVAINIIGLFKKIFIGWAQDFFDKYYYSKTIGLPIEHYHRSIENLISSNFYTFSLFNKDFLIPLILTVVAVLVIIFIQKFNKTSLFYVFLLSGFIWAVSSPMVSSGLTRDFFKETRVIEFLKAQKKPFRVYSLLPNLSTYQLVALGHEGATETDQNEFLKTMLPVNLNVVHDLDSIDGYEQAIPRRTTRILAELLSERASIGNKIAEARLKPEEKTKIFESRANLLRMMNVKYIISAFPLDERIFKKIFDTKATRFDVPVYIYENKNILPRFYFAKSVRLIESDELKSLDQILSSDINFKDLTFIECGNDCGDNSGGKIIDYEYKNGYLQLNTKSLSTGWLIFSESFDRGWQAKINGETTSIYHANYIYQAIKVPAGKSVIEFQYKL